MSSVELKKVFPKKKVESDHYTNKTHLLLVALSNELSLMMFSVSLLLD